jgi:hypothetical protein
MRYSLRAFGWIVLYARTGEVMPLVALAFGPVSVMRAFRTRPAAESAFQMT